MSPEDFNDEKASDLVVADVLAMRSFTVRQDGSTGRTALYGLTYSQPVFDGVNVSQCATNKDPDHEAPAVGCKCGWYAYDERRWWGNRRSQETGDGQWVMPLRQVSAIVRLSGTVRICPRGLKSQYMEVVAITCSTFNLHELRIAFPNASIYLNEEEMFDKHPIETLSRSGEDSADMPLVMRPLQRLGKAIQNFIPDDIMHRAFVQSAKMLFGMAVLVAAFLTIDMITHGPERALPLLTLIAISPFFRLRATFTNVMVWWVMLVYAFSGTKRYIDSAIESAGMNENVVYGFILFLMLSPLLVVALQVARAINRRFAQMRRTARALHPYGTATMSMGTARVGKSAIGVSGAMGMHTLPAKMKESPSTEGNH